jgi:hypothetical protein
MESNGNYPTLELIVEYAVAHSYVLAPGKHQIGRIENAEIKLVDTSVSARHAELQVVPSTSRLLYRLTDGSGQQKRDQDQRRTHQQPGTPARRHGHDRAQPIALC